MQLRSRIPLLTRPGTPLPAGESGDGLSHLLSKTRLVAPDPQFASSTPTLQAPAATGHQWRLEWLLDIQAGHPAASYAAIDVRDHMTGQEDCVGCLVEVTAGCPVEAIGEHASMLRAVVSIAVIDGLNPKAVSFD